ncbi:MAG: cache and HAMP domain-containing protein, partial [Gammaproteobacteria bacterium]
SLAMLAALGYVNYIKTTAMVTASIQQYLDTIVKAKQGALTEYIESTKKIGSTIAKTEIVQTYVELANRKLSGRNQEMIAQLERRIGDLLYSFQESHWGRYRHIFLINRSSRIVVSPSHGAREKGAASSLLDMDMSGNPWAMGAMQKGVPMLSGYSSRRPSASNQPALFFPVRDASNRVQAVIGIELQPTYQQQILTQGFAIGQTGRIYMTTEKGVPIAQKGTENQLPLTSEVLTATSLNGTWSGRLVNVQGREVLGLYSKHQQYPWILVAEVETSEVFAEPYRLQAILIGGLAVMLVVLVLLLLNFTNAIARPLRELTSYVEKISLGEFNIEIPDSRRKDEVGNLTEGLQRLVFSLQLVAKKLREAKALKTKLLKAKSLKKAS